MKKTEIEKEISERYPPNKGATYTMGHRDADIMRSAFREGAEWMQEQLAPKPKRSLQECLEQVAKKYNYHSWDKLFEDIPCNGSGLRELGGKWKEAAELYAASQFTTPKTEGLSLEECKDFVAKDWGYSNWDKVVEFNNSYLVNKFLNRVAELYLSSNLKGIEGKWAAEEAISIIQNLVELKELKDKGFKYSGDEQKYRTAKSIAWDKAKDFLNPIKKA